MWDQFWYSQAQFERIKSYFPLLHGVKASRKGRWPSLELSLRDRHTRTLTS